MYIGIQTQGAFLRDPGSGIATFINKHTKIIIVSSINMALIDVIDLTLFF